MPPTKAAFRDIGAVTIVDLSGLLMLGESSAVLHRAISDLMAKQRSKIILNLRDVKGIDSAGIGEIIASFTEVKTGEGRLKLLNPPQKISDLVALTRLSNVLQVYTDEAVAIQSFDS